MRLKFSGCGSLRDTEIIRFNQSPDDGVGVALPVASYTKTVIDDFEKNTPRPTLCNHLVIIIT